MNHLEYLVVGAGFSGAVIAQRIAAVLNKKVLVIDRRGFPGGNSASFVDPETGIECHRYGSHIFHTRSEKVWNYIRNWTDFTPYRHQVLFKCGGRVYFMPISLKTLCDFYGRDLSPADAADLLKSESGNAGISEPRNLEEKAVSLIGRPLYETFIAGYTQKQWGRSPSELPAEIITRLPVRTAFRTDYFSDPHQGVPKEGYAPLFKKLLTHRNIELRLNTDFAAIRSAIPPSCMIIYTGMIDEYFGGRFGALSWRSLRFEWETLPIRDFQGTAVMNYGDPDVPFTRIHEFKHYHPERAAPFESNQTILCREYPEEYRPGKEAYYPVNDERNRLLLAKYESLAARQKNVLFCGRLGRCRYWDMDKAVEAALECFEEKIHRPR